MNILQKCEITFLYYFSDGSHIIFTFGIQNPGPAPGPVPRAPKCENNMKITVTTKYENNAICHFHIISALSSYRFQIFCVFWGSGPRSGARKSYLINIPGHIP